MYGINLNDKKRIEIIFFLEKKIILVNWIKTDMCVFLFR